MDIEETLLFPSTTTWAWVPPPGQPSPFYPGGGGLEREGGVTRNELLLSVDPPGVSRGKVFGDFVSCWAGGVLFCRHDYLSRFGSEE